MRLKRISTWTASLLFLPLVVATPAAGAEPDSAGLTEGCHVTTADWEVCFSDPLAPGMNGHDPLLADRLTELVDDATAAAGQGQSASIHVSMYNWSADAVTDPTYVLAQHVVSAYQAGVDVHLVFDVKATQNTASSHNPVDLLEASIPAGDITVCPDNVGCTASDNGSSNYINHNKIFLFDVNGVQTTVQSSMNLTTGQTARYNNMVVTHRTDVYDAYLAYWNVLDQQSWSSWPYPDQTVDGTGWNAYFFAQSPDPIVDILNKVSSCTLVGGGQARILLQESEFRSDRDPVLSTLHDLQVAGCHIQVIVAESADQVYVEGKIHDADVSRAYIHNKEIIIDATSTSGTYKAVWTGSENLVADALNGNDDAMLKVAADDAVDQYEAAFDELFPAACTTPGVFVAGICPT